MTISKLNAYCLERLHHYQQLRAGKTIVNTPYYINLLPLALFQQLSTIDIPPESLRQVKDTYKDISFGYAYKQGKGTPEEIEEGIEQLTDTFNLNLDTATPQGILNYMAIAGLGIDCSGLVYELLRYSFEQPGLESAFNESLNWRDKTKMAASSAGCFIFEDTATTEIAPKDLQPLDLVLIYNSNRECVHIALVVEIEGRLHLVQSTPALPFSGVNVTPITVTENGIDWGFTLAIGTLWQELMAGGRLKLRRLAVLEKIQNN